MLVREPESEPAHAERARARANKPKYLKIGAKEEHPSEEPEHPHPIHLRKIHSSKRGAKAKEPKSHSSQRTQQVHHHSTKLKSKTIYNELRTPLTSTFHLHRNEKPKSQRAKAKEPKSQSQRAIEAKEPKSRSH